MNDMLIAAQHLRYGDVVVKVVAGQWIETGRIVEITQLKSGGFDIWLSPGPWRTHFQLGPMYPLWIRRKDNNSEAACYS